MLFLPRRGVLDATFLKVWPVACGRFVFIIHVFRFIFHTDKNDHHDISKTFNTNNSQPIYATTAYPSGAHEFTTGWWWGTFVYDLSV